MGAKAGSELARSLTNDLRDAFEGLDIELNLKFKGPLQRELGQTGP